MKSKFSTFALLFIAAHHFVVHNGWVTCQTDVEHSEQLAGEPAIRSGNQNIQILYVLECEGPQEWQLVNATDTVVPWMRDLKDRLTVSDDRPDGEDLMVHRLGREPSA